MVFTTNLRPSEKRFIQDSIKGCFRDGGAVNDAISKMKNRVLRPEEFPSMNVIRLNGKYYSFDNRRLYVFRVAEYEGYISEVPVRIVPEGRLRSERFTTNNDGIAVFVRQGRTHKHYKESWFTKSDDRGNRNIPATHLPVTLYSTPEISYPAPYPAVESYSTLKSSHHPDPISLSKQSYLTPKTPNQTYQMPKLYSTAEFFYLKPKLGVTKKSVNEMENTNFESVSDITDTDSFGVTTTQRQTYQIPEPIILPQQSNPTPTTPRQTYQMAKPHSTLEPSDLKPEFSVIKRPAKGIENPNFEQISENSDTDYIAVPPRRPHSATPYYTPSSNNSINNSYTSVKSSTNNSIINHTTVQQPETIPNVEPDQKPGLFRRLMNCCCCCRKFK